MAKCEPGCTCKRHSKIGKTCPPGCTCARHAPVSEERRERNAAARAGKRLTAEQRAALKCKPGCTCGRHSARSSSQFQPGAPGAFAGRRHSEETKAKLASYTGPRASSYKHGLSNTPTYVTWTAMLSRCYDPRNASYPSYGGRGIVVCDRWRDFENFLADMGPRPSLDHSIDRENRDCNYEPGKCRWATRAEQNANRQDPGGWQKRRQNR